MTDDRFLELEFSITSGRRVTRRLPVRQASEKNIMRELSSQGAQMPAGTTGAKLLRQAKNRRELILTERTGFRGVGAFVLPERNIGTARGWYRWKKPAENPETGLAGRQKGTLANWNGGVGRLCGRSIPMSVGVMEGLAAPLPGYAAALGEAGGDHEPMVAETCTINMSGESGTGKTETARVVASTIGHPDAYSSWNTSPRGLVEDLARHNDVLLILDDYEKCVASRADRLRTIRAVVQGVPEGHTKAIADIAKDGGLPAYHWRTFALSGSPRPMPEIAADLGHAMSQGELARVIDIPVPDRLSGGIFDRLRGTGHRRRHAAQRSARMLKRALPAAYGTLFPAWIEFLQGADRTDKLLRYRDAFVRKVCPSGDAWERRVAEKFGLLMAAGQIAVEAGLLCWPHHWPMLVMRTAYARHKATSDSPANRARTLLANLVVDADDPELFLPFAPHEVAVFGHNTLGVHHEHRYEHVLAVRRDVLDRLAGDDGTRRAFDTLVNDNRLVRGGHGDRDTSQIRRRCVIDGKTWAKPRFLLISVSALQGWAAS